MLPPLLIFNAKPNGQVKKELANFPPGAHYTIQKNAWMDERVMLMWVEVILEPYIKTAPDGVRRILFLDSYHCHMMASVVQRVQGIGVEVIHIPGGCTGVCQLVDVSIGKPFKNRVTCCWENWMVESGGLEEERTKTPSHQELSEWVIKGLKSIGTTIVRNSWRHHGFSYFPGEDSISSDDGQGSNNSDAKNCKIIQTMITTAMMIPFSLQPIMCLVTISLLSFWLTKLQKMRKRWMTTQWMMKIEDVGTILITLDYILMISTLFDCCEVTWIMELTLSTSPCLVCLLWSM
jgi:hypothetical protein